MSDRRKTKEAGLLATSAAGGVRVEKRQFGRRDVCKPAVILPPAGEPLRCTIVNLSQGGALLLLNEAARVPERFDLVVAQDDQITACRVAHRAAGKVGIEFVSLPRRASRCLNDPNRGARTAMIRALLGQQAG